MLTLAAVAAFKNIPLEKLEVDVHCQPPDLINPAARFTIRVDAGDGLTERERKILLHSAKSCELSKLLEQETTVECFLE